MEMDQPGEAAGREQMPNVRLYCEIANCSHFCPRPYGWSLCSPAIRFCETSFFRNPGI